MAELLTLAMPFFFMLAIVYGALEVSGVFKNKAVNALIAVIIAFFAISSAQFIEFVYNILPYAAILFVIVFFLGFLTSPFRKKEGKKEMDYTLLIVIAGLILIFLANQSSGILDLQNSNIITLIGFAIILIIFYAAYKQGSKQ